MTTPAEELRECSEAIAFDYPETARRLLELAAALDSQAREVTQLRQQLAEAQREREEAIALLDLPCGFAGSMAVHTIHFEGEEMSETGKAVQEWLDRRDALRKATNE